MQQPLSTPGRWIADGRGGGRAVRVSAHAEAGFLVVSTWKAGVCVGTVRLLPEEAAELVAGVTAGLVALTRPGDADDRLAALETRVRRLEPRPLTGRPLHAVRTVLARLRRSS